MKINITLEQLQLLLNEQKIIVIKKLLSETYSFNPESTEGHLQTMNINKEEFESVGMSSNYPNDINTLIKYIN